MSARIGAVVLAAGVVASMALGQFIPFLPAVGEEFALPLTAVGWLSSLITLVAGLTCLPLGIWLEARRLRGIFLAALLLLAAAGFWAAGLGAAFTDGVAALFTVRVIQAGGYALVVIIGPSLLARLLTGRARQSALALWGLCIPAGLTLATAGAALVGTAGWRGQAAGIGVITLMVAALAVTLPPDACPGRRERAAGVSRAGAGAGWAVAAVAAGFALIALIGVSVVTILPAYLAATAGLSGTRSSLLTAVVSAASVLGSLAAGAALRGGAQPARLVAAAVLMAPLSAGIFTPMPVAIVAVCAAAVLVLNGLAVSALFAVLPAVAGDRVAVAVAALTQAGSLGTLFGPPLYAEAVETMGWGAAIAVTAAIAGTGVGCALAALRGR
ncbi:MFS transporter [Nonomuraea sp. NPDC049400]|uniref:MFS transporter n=1 Tax=Nonomuraea sp. NPDC049400 TaxID=3364352 RepID=UPI00379D79A8